MAAPAVSSFQGPFVPCGAFQGVQPGYVFKKGSQGVGYYKDAPAQAPPWNRSRHKGNCSRERHTTARASLKYREQGSLVPQSPALTRKKV